jgi:predicted transcriptional regulator of viral defense system
MGARSEWAAVADLAESQWGLVTTAQAAEEGVSRLTMSRLTQAGRLERVAQGLFRVRGTWPTRLLGLKAAWLRLAPELTVEERLDSHLLDAVVSHESAAAAQEVGEVLGDVHEFTCRTRRRTRDPNVKIHVAHLDRADVRIVDGLPVTTPLRTVLDLLTEGGDGGHIGSVMVDAINSGLLEETALRHRLQDQAAGYGCRTGAELFDVLLRASTPSLLGPR